MVTKKKVNVLTEIEKIKERIEAGEEVEGVEKVEKPENLKKPCYILNYCPYGYLVEQFELRSLTDEKISCGIFGHDCPVFTCAEVGTEETWVKEQEKNRLRKMN